MKEAFKVKAAKVTSAVLVAAMTFALIPKFIGNDVVLAAGTKNGENTCLGTSKMASPATPTASSKWSGSKVYFGTYGDEPDDKPILFRVLAPNTSAYGGSTLFLDSDKTLFSAYFDNTSPYSNSWANSDIRVNLNDSFLNGFTDLEKAAIATSSGNGGCSYGADSWQEYVYGSPVSVNDKVFLLDAAEITNEAYGYSSDTGFILNSGTWSDSDYSWHTVSNHIKGGSSDYWWLRSANSSFDYYAGTVFYIGNLSDNDVRIARVGVAPALNIHQSSIIFSSLISGSFNTVGAEYKLTIKDPDLDIAVPAGQQVDVSGTTVTVPYEIGGANAGTATRASILITDKEWDASGATIKLYDALGTNKDTSGTFTLPSDSDLSGWGTDYHVYILAEDINDGHDGKDTDYASTPVEIKHSSYTVTVVGGTADVSRANAGDTVTITANDAEIGYAFVEWAHSEEINYEQADAFSTTFTMPAKDVTVTAVFKEIVLPDIADQIYTGEDITPTFGVTLDGVDKVFSNNRYTLTYENNINVGTATVTLTFNDSEGKPDARLGTKSTTFKITPADISKATVTIDDQTYNGAPLTPAATVIWNGKELSTDDYTLSYSDNLNAGQATVTVTGKGNFVETTTTTGSFTINKADLMIIANDQTYNYNGKIQGEGDTAYEDPTEIAEKVTVNGLQGNDALTSIVISAQEENVGQFPIVPSGAVIGKVSDNYDIQYSNGTLTIEPATVSIIVDDKTKIRGESDPAFTGTVTGLIAADDLGEISYFRSNADVEEAGTYVGVIDATYTANPNYSVSVTKGDFTITEQYTVTYKVVNGTWADGTTADKTETVYRDESPASVPTGMIASSGFEGGSWDTDPSTATITGDTTFTYTFAPVDTYIVTVQSDGNGTASADVTYGATGSEVTLTATPNAGYQFKEWQVISGGVTITNNKFTIGTENVVVKAIFEEVPATTYTVTFETNGGSAVASQKVEDGSKATKPADPTKEGYTFDGWYQDAALTVAFDFETTITADITLYAKWTQKAQISYTVVSGADGSWKLGSGTDYTLTVKRSEDDPSCIEHFTGVQTDGAALVKDSHYTAKPGSTVITLKNSYLESLSEGKHTITVNFDDGSVSLEITVQAADKKEVTLIPKTGETGCIAVLGVIMILSAAGCVITLEREKKRRRNAR